MRRLLVAACTLFAVATAAVAFFVVERDRADTLRLAGERTASMSRMIMAHADASSDAALQIINSIHPIVAAWNLTESGTGRTITARLKEMADSSNLISSAWVLDAAGTNVADSWAYPPKRVSAGDRPYFKAHLAGVEDPVVMGDDKPGTVTGRERFTFSRAVRNPDGSLKAVVTVGIYKSIFDALYEEAVTWPGARAGLFTMSGEVLARIATPEQASPAFIGEVMRHAGQSPSGTALITADPEPRIVSWRRSSSHPQLFASSSQSVATALESWKARSWFTGLLALAANAIFWALAYYVLRSAETRHAAEANEIAVREVNHRVKNSLQLISSLLQLRARRTEDDAYKDAVREVTNQLMALAETYRFVQSAKTLGTVDAAKTLEGLCRHLADTYRVSIAFDAASPAIIHANHATALAVIVNELVTNAIKHGGGEVKVVLQEAKGTTCINVSTARGHLPEGFSLEDTQGFGLRAVRSMVSGIGGRISARNLAESGTLFVVELPSAALQKP